MTLPALSSSHAGTCSYGDWRDTLMARLARLDSAASRVKIQPSTRSFNSLPTLKNGSFFGLTAICSPVFGFLPV